MTATAGWTGEAAAMVSQLGPVPEPVADAMRRVPRHEFVPVSLRHEAYDDTPLPLPWGGATISAPHMVALQLEWAELEPGLRVLEVGSGSGYLLACIGEMVRPGGSVHGVELVPALAREAERRLAALGWVEGVHVHAGDGREGFPPAAPYDRIIVSCATPELFRAWRNQLAPRGTLIAPLGDAWGQELVRFRAGDELGRLARGPACLFVPLRGPLSPDI